MDYWIISLQCTVKSQLSQLSSKNVPLKWFNAFQYKGKTPSCINLYWAAIYAVQKLHLSQPPNRHAYNWAVTSAAQWGDESANESVCLMECLMLEEPHYICTHIVTGKLKGIACLTSYFNRKSLTHLSCTLVVYSGAKKSKNVVTLLLALQNYHKRQWE